MGFKAIMHMPEANACSYYRLLLPAMQCYGELSKENIQLLPLEKISLSEKADAYIISRIIKKNFYEFIYTAKCNGAKIIWQTDDDIFNVPYWNPYSEYVQEEDLAITEEAIKLSDAIITSTENLKNSLSHFNKPTYVLENLVDLCCFNLEDKPEISRTNFKYNHEKPVKILWAGSATHDEDLQQIVNPVIKLIEKYKEKINFTFLGYLPTDLSEFVRIPGKNVAFLKPKYEQYISYITEVPLRLYYETLNFIDPDIGIAPLCKCDFNNSKSAIKSYEMLLSNAAFIGSSSLPYNWIKNNETGMLANSEEDWIDCISELVENKEKRKLLLSNGKKEVIENYSWQSFKKFHWINCLKTIILQ